MKADLAAEERDDSVGSRLHRGAMRSDPPRGSTTPAEILNYVSGILIVVAFAAISSWSILSANEELIETAELSARRWAEAAVAGSVALDHLMAGGGIDEADAAFLATIARTGDILGFAIYGGDGERLYRAPAVGAAELPERVGPEARREKAVSLSEGVSVAGRPATLASVSLPLASLGAQTGSIAIVTNQTDARQIYRREMYLSIAIASILAAIACGNSIGVAFLLRRKRRSDEHIFQLAFQDTLTGIANRERFREVVERKLSEQRIGGPQIALHLVCVDGFRAVNEAMGLEGGDRLLQLAADTLLEAAGPADLVARLGGDEFAVVQSDASSAGAVEALARRLVACGGTLGEMEGVPLHVGLSVGTALAPADARTFGELSRCANLALHRAKAAGSPGWARFSGEMGEALKAGRTLRRIVRKAVEEGALEVHYQPIIAADGDAITGCEALVRIPDPMGAGTISPARFVPVAEAMGIMPQLCQRVLAEACRVASAWPDDVAIAVNISALQLGDILVSTVAGVLSASGLAPQRLELEISETALAALGAPEQVAALKALGVTIVLDDFGGELARVAALPGVPLDRLKVDVGRFAASGDPARDAAVLRAIVDLARATGRTIAAAGIEREEQRTLSRAAGFDRLQGCLLARPMPEDAAAAFIEAMRTA